LFEFMIVHRTINELEWSSCCSKVSINFNTGGMESVATLQQIFSTYASLYIHI
jgi:hypothetical protein